jgi:hypothetical protein
MSFIGIIGMNSRYEAEIQILTLLMNLLFVDVDYCILFY